jgi:hypothetical protein
VNGAPGPINEPEIAVGEYDRSGRPLREEAAVIAGFASGAHRTALRTFHEARAGPGGEARGMLRARGAALRVERPVNWIFYKAVPEDGAGMVEHDRVAFTRCRPE